VPSSLQNDTLKISVIGYESFVSPIQTIFATLKDTIYLNKATIDIEEVIIKPKNWIPKTFGITTDTKIAGIGTDGKGLGYEGGVFDEK